MPRWGGTDKENSGARQNATTLDDRTPRKLLKNDSAVRKSSNNTQNGTPRDLNQFRSSNVPIDLSNNASEQASMQHAHTIMDDPSLFSIPYIRSFTPRSEEALRRKGTLPREIVSRSLQSFERSLDKQVPHEVATIRYNHYENKRKALIRAVRKQRHKLIETNWQPLALTMPPINMRRNQSQSALITQTGTPYQTPKQHKTDAEPSQKQSSKARQNKLSTQRSTPHLKHSQSAAGLGASMPLSPVAMQMVCNVKI